MEKRSYKRRLSDAYRFAGFRMAPKVTGMFGDPKARLLRLSRRSKHALRLLWKGPQRLV
ncbi:MAG: hypothetical protein ACP5I8_01190 [Phycisphaerae bacterium]